MLTDAQHQELLMIQPNFKWKNLHYEFTVSTAEVFDTLAYKDVLLLLAVHCANYYITMMSSSVVLAAT